MKKILFIYGPLGGGGAERVLIDLLNNLDYSKYEVDLCLIVNQGILLPEVPKEVTIIPLWDSYGLYYKIAYRLSIWFGNNLLFKRTLKQKINKTYDVEVSFLEGMPLKLHAMMKTKAKKITWVHCDLFNFHYTAKQFFENEEFRAYDKMDQVVSVSNNTKSAFEKRFSDCKTKKVVVYNPIDINKITRLSIEYKCKINNIFTIVTVGRLTMPKKIDRIIRLAARFKSENINVHFQIIGDGDLRNDLLKLAIDSSVADMVEFLGFLKNPFPYIKNSDMMLLSSDYEGFGLVICEAMSLGTPVVSTKTAGSIEIIDNDKYGLLCEHDDESIYQAVNKMLQSEELRNYYRQIGYKRAEDFSVENTIRQFDKLIR